MFNFIRRRFNKRNTRKVLDKIVDWDSVSGQQVFDDGTNRHIVIEYFSGAGLWLVIDLASYKLINVAPIK